MVFNNNIKHFFNNGQSQRESLHETTQLVMLTDWLNIEWNHVFESFEVRLTTISLETTDFYQKEKETSLYYANNCEKC